MLFDIKVIVPMRLADQFNSVAKDPSDRSIKNRCNASDLIQVFSEKTMAEIAREQVGLQSDVLAQLPPNQDILHVKTQENFEQILASRNSAVILVRDFATRQLVAQSIALLPDAENPDADMIDMKLPGKPETLSTLCAVVTHPNVRGKNIMLDMIDVWHGMMECLNRRHSLAVITSDNVKSWVSFLHRGLLITSAGLDPADGSTVYYAHRDLKRPANDNTKEPMQELVFHPRLPLSEMQKAFRQGWVGHRAEQAHDTQKYTGRLILAKKKFILAS